MSSPETTGRAELLEIGMSRYDKYGAVRVMAVVDRWLMVRRPGHSPFVLSVVDWNKLATNKSVIGQPGAPKCTTHGVMA